MKPDAVHLVQRCGRMEHQGGRGQGNNEAARKGVRPQLCGVNVDYKERGTARTVKGPFLTHLY